jgi:arginyl-tRNA synthetase
LFLEWQVDMFETEQRRIEQKIWDYCRNKQLPEIAIQWNWIPFSGQWGISTSFFQLAALEGRTKGKAIQVGERAQELAQDMVDVLGGLEGFKRIEAVNGYLNLYFVTGEYARRVVDAVEEEQENFGRSMRRGEQVMVEYSQPNTHKAFHVGHLRSAILGDVLCRILDFGGYDVVRANYPGDIGLHVVKWLWNYQKYHHGEKPEKDITQWMGTIYAEAVQRLAENPELDAEVRTLYGRWDRRDPEIVALWEETRQWSLDGFNDIYDLLNIRFHRYYFNSMAEHPGKVLVDELIAKGIARDERPEGPVIVKIDEILGLKQEKFRVLVVLRSDNTALYATEDLALAKIKFQDYPDMVKSYYVVDVRQSLHFQQVFKTLEMAGYKWASRCQHVSYELVNLPGNVVMASRDGNMVLLEDLIREAIERALQVVREKNPELSEDQKQAVAKAVGIGAIKYPMLARENTKVVVFDWKSALDFEGQAAPYIQYAFVRAGSILRKAAEDKSEPMMPNYELSTAEIQLVEMISRLPKEVGRATAELKPLYMASMAYELARAFNDFYNQCPVLSASEDVRAFRLRLVKATRQAISNCLVMLGITAPDFM